jgi:hypothetical protein
VELARGETIAAGLVVDGVPESIALGLTVAEDVPSVSCGRPLPLRGVVIVPGAL